MKALEELGAEIILGNTYHLYLRPGHELVRRMGGLHKFMSWNRAILTDSGGLSGFQPFRIKKNYRRRRPPSNRTSTAPNTFSLRKKPPKSSSPSASEHRHVLDECIETPAPRDKTESALKRTTQWRAARVAIFSSNKNRFRGRQFKTMAIRNRAGRNVPDLRRESAASFSKLIFLGYAVGGLAVGEPHEVTCEMAAEVTALLPQHRPRYLMGVGKPNKSPNTSRSALT